MAPIEPSNPKTVLYTLLSVFLGAMLGLTAGFVAEMLDRRVRSSSDLKDVLDIPVFGVIEWSAPKRPRLGMLNSVLPNRLRLN